MTAQYRQGRQAEALRTFQMARACWSTSSVSSLVRSCASWNSASSPRIRRCDPLRRRWSRRASTTSAGSRRIPNRLTSIIGRDDVLTDLGQELTRARLVTLLGPGGAGKTTIATELARRARRTR